jgi:acetyl-CoA C-acetyltransferase
VTGPQRVAIVGVGQTRHAPRRTDVGYAELVFEAVEEALGDAGISLGDVEHAVTAATDFLDGRTIASMSTAEVVGSYGKAEARLCGDGTGAVLYALAKMRVGALRLGLVVAHAKESQGVAADIEAAAFDPFSARRLAPDADVVAGLAAQRFAAASGTEPRAAAEAVVAARAAGQGHPKRSPLAPLTADEVLGSAPLASPLRVLDKAPPADGACALVLATEPVAGDLGVTPVWVAGAAQRTGAYFLDRDLAGIDVLQAARADAARMAGWSEPGADVVELSGQYGFQVLQFAPAFGLPTDAPGFNPSGGWLAGSPQIVTGLDRVAEAVHQLRGTAGDRQLGSPRRAYAHGCHGLGAQTHGVVALEAAS